MLYHGDLFDVLPTLSADSIDACVTDPPYGLGFMGKKWDDPGSFVERTVDDSQTWDRVGGNHHPSNSRDSARTKLREGQKVQAWSENWAREVFRVLKPGAYLVAFGGTRMYHRLTVGIEDAGFEIRDCLSWLYGSGFPKSLNVGNGQGTALKPAWEPIILARKPTIGTVATNVLRYSTGALNIDDCRLNPGEMVSGGGNGQAHNGGRFGAHETARERPIVEAHDLGRWPANVCLDEEAAAMLDEQRGELASGANPERRSADKHRTVYQSWKGEQTCLPARGFDAGGASRFYYVAKPSREERDYGTENLAARPRDENRKDGNPGGDNPRNRGLQPRGNFHPTVKPVELMRWLVKLVVPLNGVCLDPFTGSGTTGMACAYESRAFIGIEREAAYVELAKQRIAAVAPLFTGTD